MHSGATGCRKRDTPSCLELISRELGENFSVTPFGVVVIIVIGFPAIQSPQR